MQIDTTDLLVAILIAVILFGVRKSAPARDNYQTARDARLERIESLLARISENLGIETATTITPLQASFVNRSSPNYIAGDVTANWPTSKLQEFQNDLQAGRTINAIKIYREMTGVGLKDAKDAVERIIATSGLARLR